MKTYEGQRTIDGLVVTVDGRPLDEHYEVKRLTKYGFEWTYEGESPQQLALAILYDHLGDKERAIALSEPFMKAVVANFDNDWTAGGGQDRPRSCAPAYGPELMRRPTVALSASLHDIALGDSWPGNDGGRPWQPCCVRDHAPGCDVDSCGIGGTPSCC